MNVSAELPFEPQMPRASVSASPPGQSTPPHARHKLAEKDDLKKPVATRSTPEDQETLQDLEGSGEEHYSGEGPVSTTRTSADTTSEDKFIPRVWINDTREKTVWSHLHIHCVTLSHCCFFFQLNMNSHFGDVLISLFHLNI